MDNVRNSYLARYIEQSILLIKTLNIKHQDFADMANAGVIAKYGVNAVDKTDPTTWKYYLNVAGQYHFSDTMMQVVSIDTLETIDFTRENLEIHTATAEAYRLGSRDYYLLVSLYPSQIRLIHGILYPADIQTAIDAEDGKILSYQKDLVEETEESLIPDLEVYIKNTLERWYVRPLNQSNELYTSVLFATLTSQLVEKLMNIRVSRCHSREAHSFHIRMFLGSHGELDDFIPYMTRGQVLWLYRNIRYLERNSGRMEQFRLLIDNVLTKRNIPLAEYSIRQITDYLNYVPEVKAKNKSLNGLSSSLSKDLHSIDLLFDKEIPVAPGNQAYIDHHREYDTDRFKNTNSSVTQTKALMSSMVDYSNALPETLDNVALRQWCYMASRELYHAAITFRDPKTSINYSLSAQNAFVYFLYVTLKSYGYDIDHIPDYLNIRQRKPIKPSVSHLLSAVPEDRHKKLKPIAELIVSRQPVISPCLSVSSFYKQIEKIYNEAYWHWILISNTEDLNDRAYVEVMVARLYQTEMVRVSEDNSTMDVWLESVNLPPYDYTDEQALLLAKAIFSSATGITIDSTKRLANIQRMLIELVKRLSSYSVQYIREINESDLVVINWAAARLSDPMNSMEVTRYDDVGPSVYFKNDAETYFNLETPIEANVTTKATWPSTEHVLSHDPVMDLGAKTDAIIPIHDPMSEMYMIGTYEGQNVELEMSVGVLGYTTFHNLPESSKLMLKSKF